MRTGRAHRAARAGQFAPPSCGWWDIGRTAGVCASGVAGLTERGFDARRLSRRRYAGAWIALGLFAALLTFVAPTADATTIQPFGVALQSQRQRGHRPVRQQRPDVPRRPGTRRRAAVEREERHGPEQHAEQQQLRDGERRRRRVPRSTTLQLVEPPEVARCRQAVHRPVGRAVLGCQAQRRERVAGVAPAPADGRNQMQAAARPGTRRTAMLEASERHVRPDDDDRPARTSGTANVTDESCRAAGRGHVLGRRRRRGHRRGPVRRVDADGRRTATPRLPLRNLTVFDGFADVGPGRTRSTVGISGLPRRRRRARSTPSSAWWPRTGDRGTHRRPRPGPRQPRRRCSATTLSPGHQLLQQHQRPGNGASTTTAGAGRPEHARLRHQETSARPGAIPNGAPSRRRIQLCEHRRAVLQRRRDHGDQPVLPRLQRRAPSRSSEPDRPRARRAGRHASSTRSAT